MRRCARSVLSTVIIVTMIVRTISAAPLLLKAGRIDVTEKGVIALKSAVQSGETEIATTKYIIQHDGKIPATWKSALENAGASILRYIPENAYLIAATNGVLDKIRANVAYSALLPYSKAYRVDPAVSASLERIETESASDGDANVQNATTLACCITLFSGTFRDEYVGKIDAMANCRVIRADGKVIHAELTAAGAARVAAYDDVEYISEWIEPELSNNVAVEAPRMNVEQVWPSGSSGLGLTGAGQVVAVADTGLDTGNMNTLHEDVRGRISRAYARGRTGNWSDPDGHGTHVVGSVLGNGTKSSSHKVRGAAYEATLVLQSIMDSAGELGGIPTDLSKLFSQAYESDAGNPGARIHSNSWGAKVNGEYTAKSSSVDEFVFSHPDMLVVFAAGNRGVDADRDGIIDLRSLDAPATAKNCLAVGASENQRTTGGYAEGTWWSKFAYSAEPIKTDYCSRPDDGVNQGMAAFSSRGPCQDGRIKPDVVAPGTDVLSLRSSVGKTAWGTYNSYYQYNGGTSMATPLVAGAAVLARQWLVERRGIASPDGATIKALLMAGAKSLSPGQYGTGAYREIPSTYPNNVEGWGQANLGKSLVNERGLAVYDAVVIQDEEVIEHSLAVGTAGSALTIVMAYADAPASVTATKQLVNDLDLKVVSPSGTVYYPNSRTSADHVNNVEGVRIASAEAGIYKVTVTGTDVNTGMNTSLTGGKANAIRYSLVANGASDAKLCANDNFASAKLLEGDSGATSGSNVGATRQSGEPLQTIYSSATTTVWWKWTASTSGNATIDTVGSAFDTQMGIYRGTSLSSLTLVANDDDSGASQTSVCTFSCTAGTTYYICVGGYQGKTGTIKLNWNVSLPVTLSSISISGAASVASGDRTTYTCTATYSDGSTEAVSPAWEISSGNSYATITSSGVLTALGAAASQSVTVKATYSSGGISKSATRSVTIMPDTTAEYVEIDAEGRSLGMTRNVNNTTSQCWHFDLTSWPSWVTSFSHVMSKVFTVTSFSATADASVTWEGNAFFQIGVTANTTGEERLWMVVARSSSGTVLKKFLFRQAAAVVESKPDLTIREHDSTWPAPAFLNKDATLTPCTSYEQGSTNIYFCAGVWNVGDSSTQGSFVTRVAIENASGTRLHSFVYTNVSNEASGRCAFYWGNGRWGVFQNLSAGSYRFTVTADCLDDVDESDESNNTYAVPFTVTASSQPVAAAVSLAASATSGSSASFNVSSATWKFDKSAIPSWVSSVVLVYGNGNTITFGPGSGTTTLTVSGSAYFTVNTTANTGSARNWTWTLTDASGNTACTLAVTQAGTAGGLPDLRVTRLFVCPLPDYAGTPARVYDKGSSFYVIHSFDNEGEGIGADPVENDVEIVDAAGMVVDTAQLEFGADFWPSGGAMGWVGLTATYPAGAYSARVTLDAPDDVEESDETNNEASYLFAIRDPVALNVALDNSSLFFTTSGDGDWYGTKGYGSDGVDCAASLHKDDSTTSDLMTTVTGPGTVSFKWKVSSESTYDWLQFLVDGVVQEQISGTGGAWTDCQCVVEAGSHELTWRYAKDISRYDGMDCGWVDQVTWRPATRTYEVAYMPGANGTGLPQTATKTNDVALTLAGAIFTRTGYTQTGWATTDGGLQAYALGASYTENAAVTLYPVWTANTYTVTYKPGSYGSGSQQTATKTYGVALTLNGAIFTRTGYTQTGWATSDGGSQAYALGASYTANAAVTFYPVWTANTYTVTYKPGLYGSGSQQTATKTHGVALTLKGAIFTRSGYVQTGWATSDGGSQAYALGASYTANAAITLYPVWTQSVLTGVFVNGVECGAGTHSGWTYSDRVLNIHSEGAYVLTGSDTNGQVNVLVSADATVTLSGLTLKTTDCAFAIIGATCRVLLTGHNELQSGSGAGLRVAEDAGVIIADSDGACGSLTCVGGAYAAGIGGNDYEQSGAISILSGIVNASAGNAWWYGGAAGIGGGRGCAAQDIVISGGDIMAIGEFGGAGIGGGCGGDCRRILVSGGVVSAKTCGGWDYLWSGGSRYLSGAGIGYGADALNESNLGGEIEISGGMVMVGSSHYDYPCSGIGAAMSGSSPNSVRIVAGTVVVDGQTNCIRAASVGIVGGNVHMTEKDGVIVASPVGASGTPVHRIRIPFPDYVANGTEVVLTGLPDSYETRDISVYNSRVDVWLPDGVYQISADVRLAGERPCVLAYSARVNGGDVGAVAQGRDPVGFSVNGEDCALASGLGWEYRGNVLELYGDGPFVLTGVSTNGELGVEVTGRNADVTLHRTVVHGCASVTNVFRVRKNAAANVILWGTNSFAGAGGCGGMRIDYGGRMSIAAKDDMNEPAVLFAKGSGGWDVSCGAGIDCGGELQIKGGEIIAEGALYSAGIGGGCGYRKWPGSDFWYQDGASSGLIRITGGNIRAIGGKDAAGIGGGEGVYCDGVVIEGGTIYAKCSSGHGAGIGSGASSITNSSAAWSCSGDVVILGGDVTAIGSGYAAGIGGSVNHYLRKVVIKGGRVVAEGGALGCGLGANPWMSVVVSNGTVLASGGKSCQYDVLGTNTIVGGSVVADEALIWRQPMNDDRIVHRVTLCGLDGIPNDVAVTVSGLPSYYGVLDIYPVDGCIALWLPDGAYSGEVRGEGVNYFWHADVVGSSVEADVSQSSKTTLSAISILGDTEVMYGAPIVLSCAASYTDGSSKNVTPMWSIYSGSSYATISSSGLLEANCVSSTKTITVMASYTEGNITKTAKLDVAVKPIPTTYDVIYVPGANGMGAEWTDVKTNDVPITLRSAIFTRTGYTQTGWATSDGGLQAYALGATYTDNAAITLYPVWTANTYTVTYKPGSYGTGSQQTATKTYGVALTLKGAIFTRTGYTQTGWATSDGGSQAYALGASYTANAALTLYPVWTADVVAPSAPVISSVSTSYTSYAKVSWGAVSGAMSYSVYRSTTTTRPSSAYATGITSAYYYDYNATPGVTYYYWVAAVNSAGSAVSSYKSGYRTVSLSLGSTAQSFAAAGGATNVSVTANTSWTATKSVSWITLTASSGSSSGTLSYSVAANTTTASRSGTIIVTAGGATSYPKTVTLTVNQAGRVEPTVSVTSATVKPRWPWNGIVDIDYTIVLSDAPGAVVSVSGYDGDRQRTLTATSLSGATNVTASGTHRITWNVGADYPGLNTTALKVNVTATAKEKESSTDLYLVIDLSGGANAASYPVTTLADVPSGGWTDEYKTTKLVLRRIELGTFTMGSPSDEVGRYDYEDQHQVTLTKAFYMGVFEVTQRQWELVMGTKPSCFDNATCYASRPVEQVSYDDIRGSSAGAGWPASSAVDATSFLGKLRAKTGLNDFDLPTEAQWEYACRAGTTTALNSGKNLTSMSGDANMDEVGRYWYNGGSSYSSSGDTSVGTAKVGSYAPNAWGLYDMHGNVWEWCLDWWTGSLSAATDPVGAASGSYRSIRGGSWGSLAQRCRSACRDNLSLPSYGSYYLGFRLSRTPAQ